GVELVAVAGEIIGRRRLIEDVAVGDVVGQERGNLRRQLRIAAARADERRALRRLTRERLGDDLLGKVPCRGNHQIVTGPRRGRGRTGERRLFRQRSYNVRRREG